MGLGITTSGITGSSDGTAVDGLRVTGSITLVAGNMDASNTGINEYSLSASCAISASHFYGDGSNLSNVTGDARSVAGYTDNAVITWVTSDNTFAAESGITFASDNLHLTADSSVFKMGDGSDITLTHDGTTGGTLKATPISIDSVGDMTLSSSTDITLLVDGADINLKDGAVLVGALQLSSSLYGAGNLVISSSISDKDIVFVGSDGNSAVFPLILDNSAGGSAKFSNDISLVSDSSVINMGQGNDFTITHDGTTGATIAGNPVNITAGGASTWKATAGAITIDSEASTVTVDGHTGVTLQSTNSGDITLDSVADIVLDAGGADVLFKDDGTLIGGLGNSSSDLVISSSVSDKDIVFKGSDNNSAVTALTLDMSAAGNAVFGANVLPSSDGAGSLGESGTRWGNIFTSDMNFANERGDWTLIEEHDYITFRNNHTGRRFKMVIEDITDSGEYGPDIDGNM